MPRWWELLPLLADGCLVTIEVALAAALLAAALALPVALLRLYAPRPVAALMIVYIELFRGTSLLVQLFWLFFVLPQFGLRLSPFAVAVCGIGLNYGAYGAEVIRGGLRAVGRGQWDAGRALALPIGVILLRIALPQAAAVIIRPWGNLMIQLLKATSLVSLITLADLSFRAYQLTQVTMQTGAILLLVLIAYFLMAQAIAALTNAADRRAGRWRMAGGRA